MPVGSYSESDIQHCFGYAIKKHEPIKICINKIEKRITFVTKTGFYLELLMTETMRLFGSTENGITKDKNDKNVRHLNIIEVISQQTFLVFQAVLKTSWDIFSVTIFHLPRRFQDVFKISSIRLHQYECLLGLVHSNIVINDLQQDTIVLYTIVPNKLFGQLLEILQTNFMVLETFNFEFS